MALGADLLRTSEPDVVATLVRMVGTGASAPTKQIGAGVTITRTSEGLYKLTWADKQGTFLFALPGLAAATPSAMAGFTVSADTYDSSAGTLEILLSEADNSVVDLQADQYIMLAVFFKRVSV